MQLALKLAFRSVLYVLKWASVSNSAINRSGKDGLPRRLRVNMAFAVSSASASKAVAIRSNYQQTMFSFLSPRTYRTLPAHSDLGAGLPDSQLADGVSLGPRIEW